MIILKKFIIMKRITTLCLAAVLAFGVASAQKVKELKGDLGFLKGQTVLNVQYVYDGMMVGKKQTEAEYIKERTEDAEKKEKGKGETWLKGWKGAREQRYQPHFEELMNKQLDGAGMVVKSGATEAKYTVILITTRTEPGVNVGVYKQPAYVDFHIKIVETANPSNVLYEADALNTPGSQFSGYDFDAGTRLAESYEKMGKTLGGKIAKAIK